MELKLDDTSSLYNSSNAFNRTAYGIEITLLTLFTLNLTPTFNRTAYGIEIGEGLRSKYIAEELLIAPLMELK